MSTSIVSKKSDLAQQIEFERKRTEIESIEEITKARKARLLAEAEEAESLAKLRLEKANLEAEEKLAAFEGSSILSTSTKIKSFSSSRSRARRNISNLRVKSENAAKLEHCAEQRIEPEPLPVKPKIPIVRKRLVKTTELKPHEVMNRLNDLCLNDMVPENVQIFGSRDWQTTASRQVSGVNVNPFNQLNENRENVNEKTSNPVKNYMASHMKVKSESGSHELPQRPQVNEVANNNDLILRTYLDRQGRNEYITLASQIGYDGNNIAFVFYENQIRRLMSESPFEERRLEVLRASCVGQPREMVNLFCVPMKNMSTSRRIEKALDRLRQRYGVSGGLTSEPKVMAVRNGPKVSFTSTSLKLFNEDLNTLEVFAYAHDEVEKLSGQLLIDTANRLPSLLKRRYLDYLKNSPGFDSLRDFVVHELNTMTSDYAQAFFKSDEKDGSRESTGGTKNVRVRQVAYGRQNDPQAVTGPRSRFFDMDKRESSSSSVPPGEHGRLNKPPPICFFCSNVDQRHFLAECEKFKALNPRAKRQTVTDAKRCLNCLSLDHFVRNCAFPSKCRICGPQCRNKHAGALHECYDGVNLGAADRVGQVSRPIPAPRTNCRVSQDYTCRKLNSVDNGVVLLRTSAVRVINPNTGKSTLAYAQHDTASQVTLISDALKTELGLETNSDPNVKIRTLSDETVDCKGRTAFKLESLHTGEKFVIENALVVPKFSDDDSTLPHSVDVTELKHFQGTHVPVAPERNRIDVLIGQSDKLLLSVLEEREGASPEEPNYVLTRLGPIASGGRVSAFSGSLSALRVQVESCEDAACECVKLRHEVSSLRETVREYERQDEALQPSLNDERARNLVETRIKVANGRYEMPVPFKSEVLEALPNNYESALKRTLSLRRNVAKNPKLKQILLDTFAELLREEWLVAVESNSLNVQAWYLPFFVTKSAKPRVVYDGAAVAEGMSINQAVLAGENLLNGLVEVLIRFRLGRYACVADISKCFFQVGIPCDQQDWFRIVWYENNDLDHGKPQVFRFTRHVWGINSSPYVALLALNRLIEENPSNASKLTLNAIENNRYMDDILLASDSLSDLEIVAKESIDLMESCGFKLRKWVSNCHAKSILLKVPRCDLASSVSEIDLGSQPLPDSKALGLVWNTEKDILLINLREFCEASTRRQMASQLASQFDPLGMASPFILGARLILQKVSISGADWDDVLPLDVKDKWKKWLLSLNKLNDFSISRNCFDDSGKTVNTAVYQLHGFCDASNLAFSCVVYLRRVVNGESQVAFVLGKSRLVLTHQANWVIARKELEAAKLCCELTSKAAAALSHLNCSVHLWTDSQVILKWITNPDLHLVRFVKRRVDKILAFFAPDAWRYVNTSANPADVGTRENACKNSESIKLWIEGPAFLVEGQEDVKSLSPAPVVRLALCKENTIFETEDKILKLMQTSRDLYALKKRFAYLLAFVELVKAKFRRKPFRKPEFDAASLDRAFVEAIGYVQRQCFGPALEVLNIGSADDFEIFIKRLRNLAVNSEQTRQVNELKTLRNLRPCLGPDSILRVEGRLENADLPTDTKHPIILPSRHALTRLVVLYEHSDAGHAGPSYTLMKTRQRFWIIHGISSVKRYLADCAKCSLKKAKPIRQLMADLPSFRVTAVNKPFKFCGTDYFGPILFKQNRSHCKAWGLLFTCLWTPCMHVEAVTGLVLVGDAEDLSKRGAYRLGRIHRLHPQLRAGKEIVRRATVAVPKKNAAVGEIEYILRDISKIAPV